MRSVNIGIIGLGTVGGGVVRLIQRHHDDYVEHYGIDLQIKRACSRNDIEAKNLGIADILSLIHIYAIADACFPGNPREADHDQVVELFREIMA